jgi:hypothetical protein
MFSSDYPHWDNDNPQLLFRRLDRGVRLRIMAGTAAELYGLDQLPAPGPESRPSVRAGSWPASLPTDQAE